MTSNAIATKAEQSAAKISTSGSTASRSAATLALENANQQLLILERKLADEKARHLATTEKLQRREEKLNYVITNSNSERKKAAQRGNRFKAKYKNLLLLFDAVLPGTKDILANKILTADEKKEKIKKLEKQVEIQKKNINQMVNYDYELQRDIYQAGFGREYEKLKALKLQLEKLESKKVTDEPVEIPAKQVL